MPATWETVNSALPTVASTGAKMTLASAPTRAWSCGMAAAMGALIEATVPVISVIVQLEATR